MKVSFDFDGTLNKFGIQEFAKELITQGIEVWIVTSRWPDTPQHPVLNDDLFEVADELDISRERIVFTCYEHKADYFLKHPNFVFHLDDDWIEIKVMEEKCKVKGISVFGNVSWKEQALNLITKEK
jgi:hypothetical protein